MLLILGLDRLNPVRSDPLHSVDAGTSQWAGTTPWGGDPFHVVDSSTSQWAGTTPWGVTRSMLLTLGLEQPSGCAGIP